MKQYIDAITSGNLVEAKKQFGIIMEGRKEVLRQELRVELAEAVRVDGEKDDEDEDDADDKDAEQSDDKDKKDPKKPVDDKGDKPEDKE